MGNCTTCSYATPGFIAVDATTGERLPDATAPLYYDGATRAHAGIAYEPCPQCNQARRSVALTAPHLLHQYGKGVDRDGYPADWTGERDHPSWKPHLRGGHKIEPDKLKPVKALVRGIERQIAKQGELIADYHKRR